MNLTFVRRILLATIAVAGLAIVTSVSPIMAGKPTPPPPPPVTYTLAFLDQNLTLHKMNESGVAVGWTAGATPLAKVRLADGTLIDLTELAKNSVPGYDWSLLDYALEINESGQIAGRGWRIEAGVLQARVFRYSPAQGGSPASLEALRTVAGSACFIKGMNDHGDVVLHVSSSGQDSIPAQPSAGDSVWVFSGPPGMGTASLRLDAAVPGGINNFGEVTGAKDMGGGSFAFIYAPDGTYVLYGTINGSTTSKYDVSEGMAINDAGIIAGWARAGKTKIKEDVSMRAVRLRSDGTWGDLAGTSSGANSWAVAMNKDGVTVGEAGGVNGLGFVTLSGKIYSLHDLTTNPPANLKYVNPNDISGTGVICGSVTIQNADGTTSESGIILIPSAVPVP